jgi:hypothetical protein
MAFAQYANYDAVGLAELVAKKDVTAAELVEEAIGRIERHNSKLNAVVFKTYERARSAAKLPLTGPFAGVPFLLKDILGAQKGVPSRQGSNFIPPAPPPDATLVRGSRARVDLARQDERAERPCRRRSHLYGAQQPVGARSPVRIRAGRARRLRPGSCRLRMRTTAAGRSARRPRQTGLWA